MGFQGLSLGGLDRVLRKSQEVELGLPLPAHLPSLVRGRGNTGVQNGSVHEPVSPWFMTDVLFGSLDPGEKGVATHWDTASKILDTA